MAEKSDSTQNNLEDLRAEIDYLEAKIREAEIAANAKLEQAAPLRTILKWQAPERIYSTKNRRWYISVAFISILVITYSALTGNYLLILALISLLILMYAMSMFPPRMVEHEITNKGLQIYNKIYPWNKIEGFWVTQRDNQFVININLLNESINRMIILVKDEDSGRVVSELVRRIDYINPGRTGQDFITKITEGKHLPLTAFLDVYSESEKIEDKEESEVAKKTKTENTSNSTKK